MPQTPAPLATALNRYLPGLASLVLDLMLVPFLERPGTRLFCQPPGKSPQGRTTPLRYPVPTLPPVPDVAGPGRTFSG